jgi:two-component system response regulator YesN
MISFHKKIKRSSLLLRWILSCLLILMIPMISIIANFFFSQTVIVKKINDANETVLINMKNTVDTKLQSILNLNHLLLIDKSFINLFNSFDKSSFFNEVQNSYVQLNNYSYVYNDLDIMIYIPYHNYIVTNGVANSPETIYNTLTYKKKFDIPLTEWYSLLNGDYSKGVFFLSPYASYRNFGKDSFIYACTTPFVYNEEYKYNIIVSTTNSFINSYLDETLNSTFLILDENGDVLQQHGYPLDFAKNLSFSPNSENKMKSAKINNEDYIFTYAKSDITNWTYVICTPSFMLLKDSFFLRNVTLISIFCSIVLGTALIVFSQKKNYKPVEKIMTYIPHELKSSKSNEFELMEQYYLSLYNENNNMKKKIGSFADNAKEIYFLSKLKGRYFHLSENDVVESLALECNNKKFAIVSVYMDTNQYSSQKENLIHFDLLTFAIYNVADEILNNTYQYQKVIDGLFNVFVFLIDENNETGWKETTIETFQKLYQFFEEEFHISLSITIGDIFDDMNQMSNSYVDTLDTFEYRHVLKQNGILLVSELKEVNIDSNEQLEQLIQQIMVAVAGRNLSQALALSNQFFSEQTRLDLSYVKSQYHVFSLISSLLLNYDSFMDKMDKSEIDYYLKTILSCEDKLALQTEFSSFLNLICGENSVKIKAIDSSFTTKIKTYVDKNYSDCNMNIASIAYDMDLTPKYMSKLFKDETGDGLLNYINIVRINHAKELLKYSNTNIDEVAILVGFSNSRSFRRNFHKVTGITPTEYRK